MLSPRSARWFSTPSSVLVAIFGLIIFLVGLTFFFFGIELVWYGGSWYYVLCGIPLTLSGFHIILGNRLGGWLYYFAWLATLLWTIYEVGFHFIGWVPRILGPTLLLIPVYLSMAVIKAQRK